MKRVVLVACASKKPGKPARARELYQSALFQRRLPAFSGFQGATARRPEEPAGASATYLRLID